MTAHDKQQTPSPSPQLRVADIDQRALDVADDIVRQMMDKGGLIAIRDNDDELVPMALDRQFQLKAGWQIAIAAALKATQSAPAEHVMGICCGQPVHVGSPEGYTLECCGNHLVSDPREAVARIIDPHSFLPDNSGDYIIGEMVKQSRELAFRKADRILAAISTQPAPDEHLVGRAQAADAYVAEQGIEHSGGIIERAFEAGATWALPQISDEAIGTIWTAAMTAAVNILVKRQNDLNDDDGPLPVLNEQGDCINALKKWMHVDEVFLYELRHMLGVTSLPCDCCEDIRRAESDLAGLENDHHERVDQFSVMGADWAEPNYGKSCHPAPPSQEVKP